MNFKTFVCTLLFCGGLYLQLRAEGNGADWNDTSIKILALEDLLAHPDQFVGKTFKFSGGIARTEIGQGNSSKKFQFGSATSLQVAGGSPPAITVFFDDFYSQAATTVDGRQKIRTLVNMSHFIEPWQCWQGGIHFAIIASVREYNDTFQPYLQMVDFREGDAIQRVAAPAPNLTLNQPRNIANSLVLHDEYLGPEVLKTQGTLIGGEKFSTYELEFSKPIGDVWNAVVDALKDEKNEILVADRGAGVIITNYKQRHAPGFHRYYRYLMQVSQLGENTRVTYKHLKYKMHKNANETVYDPDLNLGIEVADHKQFIDEVSRHLQTR